ncbi:MAG: 7,8-didemethyl-8-hydroxy-5-deazariboflavin synthase subunit CofG [Oceanospirillaceae bacterium]|nr:7,8-didemethyl-8-hydroxy-5-deazariboflavin synthase subunit CofG [Oceanospirillaceae bacterium]MBT13006.1 7,8-didemethyl-8-hydroxy-5-deazariboflavin synthase subunit CofG [Oceanospirillaceae bacterium]|tara:strand:- start:12199 stop:13326 length:1128 start_codon:yes stop_codon:yes gene_type:complete
MITKQEALALQAATGPDLHALCNQAAYIRDYQFGHTLTYSPKVFIPLTNMCRDVCGYCTFYKTPDSGQANLMTPDQVLATVRQGEALNCREALFSLGEKPEQKYTYAQEKLAQLGYRSTLHYLHDMAEQVLENSSLLPHVNPGTLTKAELSWLKPVAASMGMMLESTSYRLLKKGGAHHACPDKVPKVRLKTLEAAGELDIPFTTGILIGIGESWEERIDSLFAINDLHMQYGHIQEVIVQNFRAKAGTPMAGCQEPDLDDMRRTLAIARLILHPSISLQAPPNLEEHYGSYISAGINDWGGISPVTKDFINPERAWPQISSLQAACQGLGYELNERLTVYPQYLKKPERYLAGNLSQLIGSRAALSGHQPLQSI